MNEARSQICWAFMIAASVLLADFVAGGLVGAALTRYLDSDRPGPRAARAAPPEVLARWGPLYRQLGLSAEQRLQIDRIMAEDRAKAARLFDEMQPRLRARYDSTATAIRAVMTPEQQQRFDELRTSARARIRRRFGAGPLPPWRGVRGAPPAPE